MGRVAYIPGQLPPRVLGVPDEFAPMLRYAWVGGSIWGAYLGGLLSTVLGLVVLRANWRRQVTQPSGR